MSRLSTLILEVIIMRTRNYLLRNTSLSIVIIKASDFNSTCLKLKTNLNVTVFVFGVYASTWQVLSYNEMRSHMKRI